MVVFREQMACTLVMSLVGIPKDTHQCTWPISLSTSVVLSLPNAGKALTLLKSSRVVVSPSHKIIFIATF